MIEVSKRLWADHIIGHTDGQLDKAILWIQEQQKNHVDGWEFCSIGRCVGAIKAANEVKACHKLFSDNKRLPHLPASKEFGRSELDKLKGVLS